MPDQPNPSTMWPWRLWKQLPYGVRLAAIAVLIAVEVLVLTAAALTADSAAPAPADVQTFAIGGLLLAGLGLLWHWQATRDTVRSLSSLANALRAGDKNCPYVSPLADDALGDLTRTLNALAGDLHVERSARDNAATEVLHAAQEMARLAQTCADDASTQGQALARIATATEQASTSTETIARRSSATQESSQQSYSAAASGRQQATSTVHSIRQAVDAVRNSGSQLQSLASTSAKIETIIELIESIASQTNLLALNAAIEAARAGEHGRGFAVVADEVRNLSRRTQEATHQVSPVIAALQSSMSELIGVSGHVEQQLGTGMQQVLHFEALLGDLSEHARAAHASAEDVAQAMHEQSAAGQEIAQSIDKINGSRVTLEESLLETTATAQYLEELANRRSARNRARS